MANGEPRLEDTALDILDNEEIQPERTWVACCSRTSVAAAKYYTTVGICATVIAFCGIQLAMYPHDLEIRSSMLPLLSGTLMLLVDPPKHD